MFVLTTLNTVQARLDRMENDRDSHRYSPFEMRGARALEDTFQSTRPIPPRAPEDTFQSTRPIPPHPAPRRFEPFYHQTQGQDKLRCSHFNSQHTFPGLGRDSFDPFGPQIHLRGGGNRPDHPAQWARDDAGDRGPQQWSERLVERERPVERVRAK